MGVIALLLVPLLPQAAQAAPCQESFPVLRDVTVNQGLGSYLPLARGKETLVKLYLALPTTCRSGSVTTVATGATEATSTRLTVKRDGVVLAAGLRPTATTLGVVGSETVQVEGPADPIFVIPAEALTPAPVTEAFTLTVEATVAYKLSTGVARTKTFRTLEGATAPITARFNRFSNSLRILAVPMGDTTEGHPYDSQFTATTAATLSEAMGTLSRIYPVPAGIGPLGKTPDGVTVPGIKYSVNPGMIHVGPAPWCGKSTNMADVSSKLSATLQAWNTANPTAPADVALGVIDGSQSGSGATGCSEGMASIDLPVAWARLVAGGASPSPAGALIAMEISHTTSLMPPPRGFNYHSTNIQADATSVDRAYNLDTRSYIGDDHTVTRLYPPWHNNNTVLERDDWLFAVCKLTPLGPTNTECPTAGAVGGLNTGRPVVVMTGLTDGTKPGTRVTESYMSDTRTLPFLVDDVSPFRLYQKKNGIRLREDGVPVRGSSGAHGTDPPAPGQLGLFSVAAEFALDATRIELVNTLTSPETVLYSADRNLNPPSVGDIEFEPGEVQNLSQSPGVEDGDPALSDDGRLIAWTEATAGGRVLYVASVADPATRVAVPECNNCLDPAWSSDGRALAFVEEPDPSGRILSVIGVDPSVAPHDPRFFATPAPSQLRSSTYIGRPTWQRGDAGGLGTSIAYEWLDPVSLTIGLQAIEPNNISRIRNLTPAGETALMPSWSHTAGDDRIVYVSGNTTLVALSPSTRTTEVLFDSGGPTVSSPSWGTDGSIAFARLDSSTGYSLWLIDTRSGGPPEQVTFDSYKYHEPSLAGALLAFERWDSAAEGSDIFLMDVGGPGTVDAVSTSNPPSPAGLRADVYLSCGPSSPEFPIAVALTPDATSGASATFRFAYDSSLACGSGPTSTPTVRAVVNDGFLQSAPSSSVPVASAPKPPAVAITSPAAIGPDYIGAHPFLDHSVIRLLGSARDAEDGELTGTALEWFLDDDPTVIAHGSSADIPAPTFGPHTVTLRARDAQGKIAEAVRAFRVEADADGDGIPGSAETCSNDRDPEDAFLDTDGDGLTNGDDYATTGQPCVATSNYRVKAAFDPQVLNPTSGGRTVTVTLERAPRPWSEIDPTTVRLRLPGAPGCAPLDVPLAGNGWQPGADQATAKFDRQVITQYLVDSCRLRDQRVPFSVTGTSAAQYGTWKFEAHATVYLS